MKIRRQFEEDEFIKENSILRGKVKSYTQAILSRTTQNEF